MYRDRHGGSAASAEKLPKGKNSQGFDLDPQETGGLLIPEDNPVTHIHGEVKVPGIDTPVKYTGSMPAQLRFKQANLDSPGFSGIEQFYIEHADAKAANHGIFTITFSHARSALKSTNPQQVHADTIGAIVQDLPNNEELSDAPNFETLDFGEFTASPHSMSSIPVTIYALAHPDELGTIIYLNPVGFETDGRVAKYVGRIGPCALQEILPGFVKNEFKGHRNLMTAMKVGKHLFGNVIHTAGEIITCHTADLREDVVMLGELGVKRAILLGEKDGLVPAQPSFEGAGHLVDHCKIIEGIDHFGPQKQPSEIAALEGAILHQFS